MIFGIKKIDRKQKTKRNTNYYAWGPFLLRDGRWVWLQRFWREYWSSRAGCGYSYYLIEEETQS